MSEINRSPFPLPYDSQPGVMGAMPTKEGFADAAARRNAAAGFAGHLGLTAGYYQDHSPRLTEESSRPVDADSSYPDLLGPPALAQQQMTELVEEEARDLRLTEGEL